MLSFFLKVLHLVNKFGEQFSYQKIDFAHKFLIDFTNRVIREQREIKGTKGIEGTLD